MGSQHPYLLSGAALLILLTIHPSTTIAAPTSPNVTVSQNGTEHFQGWAHEPDGRGTMGTLYSCLFTMFLCSWTSLCLNIPSQTDSKYRIFWRRLWLTALRVLGPEFTLQMALGQWRFAKVSVKDFHRDGYSQWTMRHAFFADMGGLFLPTGDAQNFPIDAKQLHFLVTEDFVEYPKISKLDIDDRNKVDTLFRIITTFQIVWFMLNVLARWIQHLLVTTLELITIAFIICTIFTTFCWSQKPADVRTSLSIHTPATVAEIQLRATGQGHESYARTPLDCISRAEWPWSLYWAHWISILRIMHINFAPKVKPVDRLENTIFPDLPGGYLWIFLGMATAYASVFVAAWNDPFPSPAERLLWRMASLGMMSTVFRYWLVTQFAYSWFPALTGLLPDTISNPKSKLGMKARQKIHVFAEGIRNNSPDKDPLLSVPLKATIPMYVLGFIYCASRSYILLEDLLQFRRLPDSAFLTVEWTSFLPRVS